MEESNLKPINSTIRNLLNQFSPVSEPDQKFECDECQDSGWVYVKEEKFGRIYEVGKHCVCRLEKVRRTRLNKIPPKFQDIFLVNLKPDPERHPKQIEIIAQMKTTPFDSYFFGGDFGTGKTLFLWTLYREAVMNDKKVVACTLSELLQEYRTFIQCSMNGQELTYPRLSAGDLRQDHTKYSIFLDDVDKAKPTEYAAEQLFELADAIYAFNHQIVVTTNLSLVKLVSHFEKADERFGGAIVRRLIDNAHIYEMF